MKPPQIPFKKHLKIRPYWLSGRVFANGPEDLCSISGRVIPKKKWYLISPCLALSIIRYVSRIKWSNPGKGVAPSPTPQCSSYWKGSFQEALNYGYQLYFYYNVLVFIFQAFYSYVLSSYFQNVHPWYILLNYEYLVWERLNFLFTINSSVDF